MSNRPLPLASRLFVILQHILPQHTLSRLMYALARVRWGPLKDLLIGQLVRRYHIDLSEAAEPNPRAYDDFNAFFTRALRPGARPLDADPRAVVSPVDGLISQIGSITSDQPIQAKGEDFTIAQLLGGDEARARAFAGGRFATIYLAPSDYHRIHMPVAGALEWMGHIQGRLFSVNATTTRLVPGLLARNERVVCQFETAAGRMTMVLVGAIFVGGIETVWSGEVTPRRMQTGATHDADHPIRLERGAEMGRFNLGSTVILLFEPSRIDWDARLVPGCKIQLGQRLGTIGKSTDPIPET
ncbi:MAG: phosphatidylserine decarboxylase [Sphingobacteriia bacterium]|nr:phosphatidylserine decarboxylase [Sphingobacteriia bacterium]NCC39165.1 phosphatidylserine decarboxylase [Gammaproteobacteria bacterium]